MPEPLFLAKAIALAAVVAGVMQFLAWWILGAAGILHDKQGCEPHWMRDGSLDQTRIAVGGALGVGIGFLAGAWALDQWPHWPPAEDRDRLLAILLPAAILVECLAALPRMSPWLSWGMRLILSILTTPILLYATTYLVELAGPGSREWSDQQMAAWLIGLTVALATVWITAFRLISTDTGRFLPLALAMTTGGAGVTIMLSGYLTGGELALPLAGAVGGATLAVAEMRMLRCNVGAVSIGLVGLFGLLVIGRFFGELTTAHALILLATPFLICVPELLPRRKFYRWVRAVLAVVLVLIPVGFVVTQAHERFELSSGKTSGQGATTVDDYRDYK